MVIGCKRAPTDAPHGPISVNSQLCQSSAKFTLVEVAGYTIKVFEPMSEKAQDIWQGPVCIENESLNLQCGFDFSLVKSITPTPDKQAIDIVTFSGSNSVTTRIVLRTCRPNKIS